ncbi:MAG: hypothetical protein IJF05_00490 [Clostridia bacterium]|nr:hypothetical protein [Clostridia bacterium]
MKKRDEIKLDALSQINDDIIERNTVKRARLLAHPRIKRSIIYSASAIAACLAIVLSVVIGILGGGGGVNPPVITPGQIPVYEGMTVSNTYNTVETASRTRDRLLLPKPPHKDDVKQDDEIQDSLGVAGAMEEIYYATVGQDVYVSVHINNPDQYEILSFTLNGKTYSSYMFEEGSDMETLVLKVNVGEITGIKEYTIDAIKYVDGTEIKDVRMEGDRTVAISVGDGTVPSASVSALSSYYSLSFTVDLSDASGLIDYYGNYVYLVLSDENGSVVRSARIVNATTPVVIDGLNQNTDYGYAVFAVYKSEGDNAPDVHTLAQGSAKTQSGLAALDVVWQENSSSFRVTLAAGEGVSVDSVKIFDGESAVLTLDAEAIRTSGSADIPMSDLLYGQTYSLEVAYTLNGEAYTQSMSFVTAAFTAPTVSVTDVTVTENTMTVGVSVSDTDGVATKLLVTVGGKTVYEYIYTDTSREESFTFTVTELDDATPYTVKATVLYDLRDGDGERRVYDTVNTKTLAAVTAINFVLRNVEDVYVGGRLILQIPLVNDNNVAITHVMINGKKYAVASTSTSTVLNVEIDTASMAAGTHTLTLEAFYAGEREILCKNTPTVTAQLLAKFAFVGISIVGENYESKVCYDNGEALYLIINLEGGEGATVTSAVVSSSLNKNSEVTLQELVKIDANHYRIPLTSLGDYTNVISVKVSIKSLTYVKDSQSVDLTIDGGEPDASANILPPVSDTAVYIYDADDLKNVDDGYHYILANDIDLGGVNWTPVVFNGSLDGNGYAIKNFTCVGDESSTTGFIRETTWRGGCHMTAGLFSSSNGTIYNLRFDGMYVNIGYNVSTEGDGATFNLFGSGTHTLVNCAIDSTSSITVSNTGNATDYSSFSIVLFSASSVTYCASYANVSMNINGYPETHLDVISGDKISNCIMGGNISINGTTMRPTVKIPALTSCYNECSFTSKNVYLYVGETVINTDPEGYSFYPYDCTVKFTGDGYRAYINDGYNTVLEVTGEGIAKPDIPVLQKKENLFEINLPIIDENVAYMPDGVTLMARMGLELTDYEIPSDVTTVIIYLPSEYGGVPITHIDFVQITYNGELYAESPYKVKVVIPDGIKTIGLEINVSEQSFTTGTVHELLIPESVETVYPNSFTHSTVYLQVIYCKAAEKPASWEDNWNKSNAQVVWGYTEE